MADDSTDRVAEWWRRTPESRAAQQRTNWLEHPRLLHYTAKRITGNPFGEYWKWAMDLDHTRPVDRMLSLGCGGGILERRVAETDWARHIDAVDVSSGAVEQAVAAAEAAGLADRIDYRVADVDTIALEADSYDVVAAQMSLHHVTELEHVVDQICRSLRPGGVLILNEYTGPTRWQLPDAQIEAINRVLRRLPKRYRIRASDGELKKSYQRIDLEWFDANDPSESVRSADIMPVLYDRMNVTVERPYGGGLLQFLLEDIVWCFQGVRGTKRLGKLVDTEKRLELDGTIASDFTVAVARPR